MHSRRDLLRHIFYSGGVLAAGPLLQACGSNSGGNAGGGGGGLPAGKDLPLEPGPLMDIGALRDSGVDLSLIHI